MIHVFALSELLIDFTCISTDTDGYPTMDEETLRDVVTFACTSAGLSTTRSGGISSVPDYKEVLERMASWPSTSPTRPWPPSGVR